MLLLENVFKVINDNGLNYCVLNKYETMPESIPSDIDIMYMDADEKYLDKLVATIANETQLLITQKIIQSYYEFTYILSYPKPSESFQLQLDFYRTISFGKIYNVLPAEDLIKSKRFYKCFYVPDYYDELKYIWIRRTLKNDINEQHILDAKILYERKPDEYMLRLSSDFGQEVSSLIYNIILFNSSELFHRNYESFIKAIKNISYQNCGILFKLKLYWFRCVRYLPIRLLKKCGMSIAFLAPDGAGKSTIINKVVNTCAGSFYGIQVKYFRPRLLPNIGSLNIINPSEEVLLNPNPHSKPLNNPIKSLLRYFFYNSDFILGELFNLYSLKIKKQLIIFDRYYYDYYVDMKRYQYKLPKWFPYLFSWSIPCPDIVFIIDVPADILYLRKHELDVKELSRQRDLYKKIGNKNKNAIIINGNQSIEKVTEEITFQVLLKKAMQTNKIMYQIKINENGIPL